MIRAADLATVYAALAAEHATYWFNDLAIDNDGNLIAPTDATHYILRVTNDPAVNDMDSEAYSNPVLTVQAWASTRGAEWGVHETAVDILLPLRWERLATRQIPSDDPQRHGLTTDYEATR